MLGVVGWQHRAVKKLHLRDGANTINYWAAITVDAIGTMINDTNMIYPLTDHLGSVESITDSSGTLIVKESFDPWGERRGSNWSGAPSGADMTAIANATRRGCNRPIGSAITACSVRILGSATERRAIRIWM